MVYNYLVKLISNFMNYYDGAQFASKIPKKIDPEVEVEPDLGPKPYGIIFKAEKFLEDSSTKSKEFLGYFIYT